MGKPTTINKMQMPPITDAVGLIKPSVQAEPVSDAVIEKALEKVASDISGHGIELPPETLREVSTTELQFGIIEIPFGPLPGYVKRRVDLGRMSQKQSLTLAAITSGLQFKEATLIDGTRVRSELHAIKWVLENLG